MRSRSRFEFDRLLHDSDRDPTLRHQLREIAEELGIGWVSAHRLNTELMQMFDIGWLQAIWVPPEGRLDGPDDAISHALSAPRPAIVIDSKASEPPASRPHANPRALSLEDRFIETLKRVPPYLPVTCPLRSGPPVM